ncbi:MAG: MAPEG family protein [Stenotrophobium sp.]
MIVTPLYTGLLALWFFVLSYRVVQLRGHGASLGDGGDPVMLRRIRAHGNFSEYVPLILLMIGMLELSHYPAYLLHALGITLLVARILHGVSLSFTEKWKFGRFYGTLLTFILLLAAGSLCVFQGLRALCGH